MAEAQAPVKHHPSPDQSTAGGEPSSHRTTTTSISSAAAACSILRSDLNALRAHVLATTAEQSKWILKMNRVVKKVVPALIYVISTNTPMPDEELRWLQIVGSDAVSSSSSSVRPGSSSSAVTAGGMMYRQGAVAAVSPYQSSMTGSPAEASFGANDISGGDQKTVVCDPAVVGEGEDNHSKVVEGGGGGHHSKRCIASADSNASQCPNNSISSAAVLPALVVLGTHSSIASDVAPGAPLTTTTGSTVPVLSLANPSATPSPSPRGTTGKRLGLQAVSALEEHTQHHIEQHRRQQVGDLEPHAVHGRGSRARTAPDGVPPTHMPPSPRRVPSHGLQVTRGGKGPVLTMSCYGATHSHDTNNNSISSPQPPSQHPWTIGTSTRHGHLVEEAQLAAALQLTVAQLRSSSPARLEEMIAASLRARHPQQPHPPTSSTMVHPLRPISDAAIVGASLSALGLAGHHNVSPTRGASAVSGRDVEEGPAHTVTPLTSYCRQQHLGAISGPHYVVPSGAAGERPFGASVLRSHGAAPHENNSSNWSDSKSLRISAATPPSAPAAAGALVGKELSAQASQLSIPRLPASARVKKGLVLATHGNISAPTSATTLPVGVRGGAVGAPCSAGGTPSGPPNDRAASSIGLSAWSPSASQSNPSTKTFTTTF
jgi:hypothetical protein